MNLGRKGRMYEWKIREVLRGEGYLVVRSAASQTPIDLIAFHPEKKIIKLVQCKSYAGDMFLKDGSPNTEMKRILEELAPYTGTFVVTAEVR